MQSYKNLLQYILDNGESHTDRTGVGTVSVFGYQFRHCMHSGFPLLTTKKLPFRWIAEELFWFLSGSTNENDLRQKKVDIWKEWATEGQCNKFGRNVQQMGPIYGGLWRRYPTGVSIDDPSIVLPENYYTDQIAQLINDITSTPNSRRLIVSGWHPFYQKRVSLPPCHTLWQCKVYEKTNEISLQLYARSIDAFLGLPFNIASYALLLSLIGKVCNLRPRDLVISFGDLHIYKNHLIQVETQLTREPYPLPYLNILNSHIKGLDGLLSYKYPDLRLINYNSHPKIEAEVAV